MSIEPNDKVLVIGSGGREHCIAHVLAKSASKPISSLLLAITVLLLGENVNVSATDVDELSEQNLQVDLVVVGPEAPLVAGLADALNAKTFRYSTVKGGTS